MKKKIEIIMSVCFLAAALLLARKGAEAVLGTRLERSAVTVCVDAGHGGADPGKVGCHGEQEKDINLQIAYKVRKLLEEQDINVVMLREKDEDLADAGTQNRKVSDMQNRVKAIDKADAQLVVSIHQNSFPDAAVKGAQVFYYSHSPEGRSLAEYIQESLIQRIDETNTRQEKANDSYYILKRTPIPTVIVECGFLSNYEESELLTDPQYQERLAWAIVMGIMQYLNQ